MAFKIKDINDINTNTEEGKLLIAALSILTVTNYPYKEPCKVIYELKKLYKKIERRNYG